MYTVNYTMSYHINQRDDQLLKFGKFRRKNVVIVDLQSSSALL